MIDNTVRLTQSQALKLIAANVCIINTGEDDDMNSLPIIPRNLHQLSEMEYIFTNDDITMRPSFYFKSYSSAPYPNLCFMSEKDAQYLVEQYRWLVGKTEMVNKATIIEMTAANVWSMAIESNHRANINKYMNTHTDDWAVFVKVRYEPNTPYTKEVITDWLIFDNTEEMNWGIPTISLNQLKGIDKNIWQTVYDKNMADKNYQYMSLHEAFAMYHSLDNKEFLLDDFSNRVIITYEPKHPSEGYYKWHCMTSYPVYSLYANHCLYWVDSDGDSFDCTNRKLLFEYIGEDTDEALAIREELSVDVSKQNSE